MLVLLVAVFSTALAENTLRVSNHVATISRLGGYLETRTTDPNNRQLTPWKPVCGGSQWTKKEALVACNQLRYHNTTTIAITSGQCSSFPYEINDAVEISGCRGVETTLEDCIITLSTCNNWGGIICSSLEMCSENVCSNSSHCQPTSTCYNCTTPPELNCMCYSECSPPCLNGGRCGYTSTCQCPPGWTGLNCGQSLASTPPPHPSSTTEEPIYPATPAAPTLVSETCQPSCLDRGTCSFVRSCQCPPNCSGPQYACEEGGIVTVLYSVIAAVGFLLVLSLLILPVAVVASREMKKGKKKSKSSVSPDDADDYLTMQERIHENTHIHEQHAQLEDIPEVFEEDNKSVFEVEYQNNEGLQRDQRPSNRIAATSINKTQSTSHYTELLSGEIIEHNYATISDPQKLALTPYYYNMKLSTPNVAGNVHELTEIPTEESLPQLKAAESTSMAEHNNSSVYCGLKHIPKPWNESYENITHGKYTKNSCQEPRS